MTIGAISGGSTYNVISPHVLLKGAIRWFSDRTRDHIVQRVEQIAKHVCEASNATCTVSWFPPCPATINGDREAAFVEEQLKKTFGPERVVESPLVMLSEDFSCFLDIVPGCFYFLGAGSATHAYPNHHPAFDIDENAMAAGIEAHVTIAQIGPNYLLSIRAGMRLRAYRSPPDTRPFRPPSTVLASPVKESIVGQFL